MHAYVMKVHVFCRHFQYIMIYVIHIYDMQVYQAQQFSFEVERSHRPNNDAIVKIIKEIVIIQLYCNVFCILYQDALK